jgi:hypothetical protein
MSAVPEDFMHEPREPRVRLRLVDRQSDPSPDRPAVEDRPMQNFWHWFAVGVLIFCWIAEATLCAERGF